MLTRKKSSMKKIKQIISDTKARIPLLFILLKKFHRSLKIGTFMILCFIISIFIFSIQNNTSPDFISKTIEITENIIEKKIDGQIFAFTDLALKTGISDATVYIYAVGTKFNYKDMENSLINAQKIGSTDKVKVLVLYDPPISTPTRRTTQMFLLTKSEEGSIQSEIISDLGIIDSTDPQVLYDFLAFGMKNFPAKKNIFILDGIGKGTSGLFYDESSNSYLSAKELEQAISSLVFSGGAVFDLTILNTSYSASLELIASLPRFTKYIFGTTDTLTTEAFRYGQLIETLNKYSTLNNKDLFVQLFTNSINTSSCTSWNIYNTRNIVGLTNGLETLSTKIFRDGSENTRSAVMASLSDSARIKRNDRELSLFSFTDLLSNLEISDDPQTIKAGLQMRQDIATAVTNPFCTNKETFLFSFPENQQSALGQNFATVPYTTLPSFKEFVRLSSIPEDLRSEPVSHISVASDSFSLTKAKNANFCGTGSFINGRFSITDTQILYSKSDILICPKKDKSYFLQSTLLPFMSNASKFLDQKIITIVDNNEFQGILRLDTEGKQPRLNIDGTSTTKLSFRTPLTSTIVRFLYPSIDSEGQNGFFYSEWLTIDSETIVTQSPTTATPFVAYTFEERNTNRIRLYGSHDNSGSSLKHSYNIFVLYTGAVNKNTVLSENVFVPTLATKPFTVSFAQKETTATTYSKQGYQYIEYIYAQKINFDPKKRTITPVGTSYGDDIVYYRGEVLPSQPNIIFWSQWLSNKN